MIYHTPASYPLSKWKLGRTISRIRLSLLRWISFNKVYDLPNLESIIGKNGRKEIEKCDCYATIVEYVSLIFHNKRFGFSIPIDRNAHSEPIESLS